MLAWYPIIVSAAIVFLPLASSQAKVQTAPAAFSRAVMPEGEVVSEDKPVVLTADEVEYLQQEDVVVARGKVEVVQGDTLLLADKIVYHKRTGVVHATGNVSTMDAVGNVVFADEAELLDDMRSGVIEQFKARLNDETLFAAERAVKVDDQVLELERALYSPCKVKCIDDMIPGENPRVPLWQLRAEHVQIDDAQKTVEYKNAQMELFGIPVFYTPYLSHAMPGSEGKSGVTIPEFERSDRLGNVYMLPTYIALAPDRDLLLTPIHTSREGELLRGKYTQQFDTGRWVLEGSGAHVPDRNALGQRKAGRTTRGHLFTKGDFDVNANSRWGFDVKRTSNDTYLREYEIDGNTVLPSRVYGETYDFVGTSGRSSLTADAVAFQGLALGDNSQRIPLALPLLNFDYETAPGVWGSRYFLNSNMLAISRDLGSESQRLSGTVGWRLPYATPGGQLIELTSSMRADVYRVSHLSRGTQPDFNGTTGRVVPQISGLWRYPFMNRLGATRFIVEPVASVALSPVGGNPETIPNEDSLVPEFTDTNLFSPNRFSGYDRVEQGARASYGMRGLVQYDTTYVDWLLGQHYRTEADRNFPFSNNLDDQLSDYVGKFGVQLYPFYLAYRFRADKETLAQRRKELEVNYTHPDLSLGLSYIELKDDPILAPREEVVASARMNLTQQWAIGAGVRKDLLLDQITTLGGEIIFKNECINVAGVVNREYTRDRSIEPKTRYLLRLSLKNLE